MASKWPESSPPMMRMLDSKTETETSRVKCVDAETMSTAARNPSRSPITASVLNESTSVVWKLTAYAGQCQRRGLGGTGAVVPAQRVVQRPALSPVPSPPLAAKRAKLIPRKSPLRARRR